jgi:tetratricopeptide (TPR) repeat protein
MEKAQLQQALQKALDAQLPSLLEELAQQAIEQTPDESFGYYYLSEAYFLKGQMEDGFLVLEKALETEQNNPLYQFRLAFNQYQQGQAEALDQVLALAEAQAQDAQIQEQMALFYLEKEEYEQAIRYAQRLVQLQPQNTEFQCMYSAALFQAGQAAEALAQLGKTLSQDPRCGEALNQRIMIAKQQQDYPLLVSDLKTLVELEPENELFQFEYAQALHLNGQAEAALQTLGKVLALQGENEVANEQPSMLQGKILMELGRTEEAVEAFKNAVRLNDRNHTAYTALADARIATGDQEMANVFLEMALDFVPDEDVWNIYLKMGQVAESQSDLNTAKEHYEKALESEDGQGQGHLALGKLYFGQGERAAAFEHLRKAVDHFAFEADTLLQEHFQEELLAEQLGEEEDYLQAWRADFAKNAQSPSLKPIFGVWWGSDLKATQQQNKLFADMPANLKDLFLDAFGKMIVCLTHQGLAILNPESDDIRAVYRILSEDQGQVKVYLEMVGGGNDTEFSFVLKDNYLIIKDFGNEEAKIDIYLQRLPNLSSAQTRMIEQSRKKGLLDYMALA